MENVSLIENVLSTSVRQDANYGHVFPMLSRGSMKEEFLQHVSTPCAKERGIFQDKALLSVQASRSFPEGKLTAVIPRRIENGKHMEAPASQQTYVSEQVCHGCHAVPIACWKFDWLWDGGDDCNLMYSKFCR